jgi:hypothetical protein
VEVFDPFVPDVVTIDAACAKSRFIQASLYLNFGPGCGLPLGA